MGRVGGEGGGRGWRERERVEGEDGGRDVRVECNGVAWLARKEIFFVPSS